MAYASSTGTKRALRIGAFVGALLVALCVFASVARPALADTDEALQAQQFESALERAKGEAAPASAVDEDEVNDLISRLDAAQEEALATAQPVAPERGEDIASTMAIKGVLNPDEVFTKTLGRFDILELTFTVPTPQIVSLVTNANGNPLGGSGMVGMYTLETSGGTDVDMVSLYKNQRHTCTWVLPAGDYVIRYLPMAEGTTYISLGYTMTTIDSSEYQTFLPTNRRQENSSPIELGKSVWGYFYYGFDDTLTSTGSITNMDGHYYDFTLTQTSHPVATFVTSGPAYISLIDASGNVLPGKAAKTQKVSGQAAYLAQCDFGVMGAGTYHLLVITDERPPYDSQYLFSVDLVSDPTIPPDQPANGENVYRLRNPKNGEHILTTEETERVGLIHGGWAYEGVAWIAPKTSSSPVYRLYNTRTGEHFYTADANERRALLASTNPKWNDEGILCYSDDAKGKPVRRLFNATKKGVECHLYTVDENEYRVLPNYGWTQEGEKWYGVK